MMKRFLIPTAILIMMLALTTIAGAKQSIKLGSYQLSADQALNLDFDSNTLEAVGNVHLTTADGELTAKKMRAVLTKAKAPSKANWDLVSVSAEGGVKMAMVRQGSGQSMNATATKIDYYHTERKARMAGNVSVVVRDKKLTEPAKLTGETAVIQMLESGGSSLEATGGASLVSADGDLKAESIQAQVGGESGKLDNATAEGNVRAHLDQGGGRIADATCARIDMMSAENKAILRGDVSITVSDPSFTEPAHLAGEKATVLLAPPRRILMEGDTGGQTELRMRPNPPANKTKKSQ